jgi:hypothetical protein
MTKIGASMLCNFASEEAVADSEAFTNERETQTHADHAGSFSFFPTKSKGA